MYEDRTQNYNPEIHEKHLVDSYMTYPSSCHIIYSHVQTIAYTQLIILIGNNFLLRP